MCYSRWALSAVIILFALWVFTCESATVGVFNGSATNTLCVWSSGGTFTFRAGVSGTVFLPDGIGVTNGVDGVETASWVPGPGREYRVQLADGLEPVVCDSSSIQTGWFWSGYSFAFILAFGGLTARWVRRVMVGSVNESD